MIKSECIKLTKDILRNTKKILLKEKYNFDYDLVTPCREYEFNIGSELLDPAYYDRIENKLFIDINYIYDYTHDNCNSGICSLISNDDLKYFTIIYHEITHVYQDLLYRKYKHSTNKYYEINYVIQKLFYDELAYYYDFYNQYHHYYPNEHEANSHGIVNSINKLNVDEIKSLKSILLYGYDKPINKVYSPFEILKNELNTKEKKLLRIFDKIESLSRELTLYDKLSLGLIVDKQELDEINRFNGKSSELIKKLKKYE